MADIEYSSEYSVYMTTKGIRFLTNKISIKIMGLLTVSERTVTEIADLLDLSKSSIQSNMMKLARWDLVVSSVDPNDKRRVIYAISSMLLFKSVTPGDTIEMETEGLIRQIIARDENYFRNIILLAGIMPYRLGSTILPLMARVSGMIAEHLMPKMDKLPESEQMALIESLAIKMGFPKIHIMLGEKKAVRIESQGFPNIEVRVLRGLFAGFFNRYLYSKYGFWYYQDKFYTDADGSFVIEFSKYNGDDAHLNKILTEVPNNRKRNDWDFSLLSKDNESILFGNETQIKILTLLQGQKKSLKDISDELGIPPVTVHMNISKLMEVGVVTADNNTRSKYVFYTLDAKPLAVPTEKENNTFDTLVHYLGKNIEDPTKFFEIMSLFVVGIFRDAGINVWYMLEEAGSDIATVYVKDHPGVTAQEFLDFVCKLSEGTSSPIAIDTYIPLCFKSKVTNGNSNPRYMSPLFKGIVENGLRTITGDQYRVSFKFDAKSK